MFRFFYIKYSILKFIGFYGVNIRHICIILSIILGAFFRSTYFEGISIILILNFNFNMSFQSESIPSEIV